MSGYTKHLFQNELGNYRKKFKKSISYLYPLMPADSTASDYYTMFSTCFQDLVEEYESFSKYYTRKETELLHFKRKSRYRLPKWQLFIDDYLASSDTNGCFKVGLLSQNEQEKKLQKLVSDCKERVLTRETKKQYKNRLVQYTCPRYVQKLIGMYLRHRRTHSGDEDYRYHIVSEIAKYKHHETIQLLQQINNTEPVFPIRHIAFLALQQFGVYVRSR